MQPKPCGSVKQTVLFTAGLCLFMATYGLFYNRLKPLAQPEAMQDKALREEWGRIEQQLAPHSAQRGGSRNFGASGIPKIMHYVFKNEMVYEPYRTLISSCLDQNPEWKVFLWQDSDNEKFVKQHFASFADKFMSYEDPLEKSDAIRYMILHKFGGIYLDMDVQCLKPFDQLLQLLDFGPGGQTTAFLGEERREQTRILYGNPFYTMNSLMGSRPGHPFFLKAICRMQLIPNLNHARLSTGPDFLTKTYHSWVNCTECQASHPMHIFPARLVSPLMDTKWNDWEQKCEPFLKAKSPGVKDPWRQLGCGELIAKGWQFDETDRSTIAVHTFLHLVYGSQEDKKTFDLFNAFPRIKPSTAILV